MNHLVLQRKGLLNNPLTREIQSFLQFLRTPRVCFPDSNVEKLSIFTMILVLTVIQLVLNIIGLSIMILGLWIASNLLPQSLNNQVLWTTKIPPILLIDRILVGAMIAPCIEEIAYRLALVYRPIYLAISIGALCYMFFPGPILLISQFFWTEPTWWLRVGFGMISGTSIYFLIVHYSNRLQIIWQDRFSVIFYSLALVFGLIHLLNQPQVTTYKLMTGLIVVLPQIIAGLFLGYVRIKYGFRRAILQHIINNSIVAVSFLF